jgi:arylsulfatase A-like enzyme
VSGTRSVREAVRGELGRRRVSGSSLCRALQCILLGGLLASACSDDEAAPAASVDQAPEPEAPRLIAPVARVESTDRWLDLIAQRPSAVIMRDEAVHVDMGRRSAIKHIAPGQAAEWQLGVEVEGRMAGLVVGRSGSLDLPIDGELAPVLNPDPPEHPALAVSIELCPMGEGQSVTVLWEEQPLAHLPLSKGWQRRTLSLPADRIHAGDNRLRLHFRRVGEHAGGQPAAAAVGLVELGRHERIVKLPPEGERPAPLTIEPETDGGVTLGMPAGTSLVYYVVPPRRGKLLLDVRGQGSLQVLASSDADHREGRAPTVLFQEPLRPAGDRRELDLTAWGGVPTRLELRARGSKGDSGATVRAAEIVARRSQPLDQRPRAPRDIIVLGIEGARADAFFDPGRRPTLEAIDALRRESIVFERAYALGPAAVPTHAGWLSSVAPPVHLTVRGTFVADGQVLLPEALSRAGYLRALVSSNSSVEDERGLTQGFDLREVLAADAEEDAAAVVTRALALVQRHSERWFLYIDVNDPQAPYEPPRELLGETVAPLGAPLAHLTHIWVGRVYTGKHVPSEDELRYVRRLYRGELQVVDRAVGELVEALRANERLDDAIVVLVGIHGEEFFEHGGAGHGRSLYEESIHVPLMIRAPTLLAPGKVTAPVDLLDLAPTLADLVGVPAPDGWQGESLVPVIDDPQPPPRLVLAYMGDGSRAAIVGDHKLVLGPGVLERFYDLVADPGELHDRRAEGGVAVRMVRTALSWQAKHQEQWKRARWGTGANLRPAFAMDLGM